MAKLTEKELQDLIQNATEEVLKSKGLSEVIRKINFTNNKEQENTKEVKTVKFFKAMIFGDMATVKDLSGGISDQGATLLPTEFVTDVIDRVVKQPLALRSKCRVVPVQFRSGTIPTIDGGVQMQWSDNDSETDNKQDIKINNLGYKVHRLDGFTALGKDMLSDTPVQLYNYLLSLYADAIMKAENTAILCGGGDSQNQPIGVREDKNVTTVSVKTATKLEADDVMGLPYLIPATYRQDACYIAGTNSVKQMRLMKDGQGRYLWAENNNVTGGQLPTFNGYPVVELDGILPENLGTGHNETEIIFGNLENYYLFDRGELATEMNTQGDTAFFKNRIITKVSCRLDGKVAVPKSFVRLTGVPTGKSAS